MSKLKQLKHPLIEVKLTVLRDKNTPSFQFRRTLSELASLMSYEVFKNIDTISTEIYTPLEKTHGKKLINHLPCIVSILRAGNGLADAFSSILPEATIGHLGMQRNNENHKAEYYYEKLPEKIDKKQVILVDPMLATGGSAVLAVEKLKERKVKDIKLVCLVAAPEGIQNFHKSHNEIEIVTASVDRQLDHNSYILPGLGDAGDRIYNT